MNYELFINSLLIISACISGIFVWISFIMKLQKKGVYEKKKALAHFIGFIGGYFTATIIMVIAYSLTIVLEGKNASLGALGLGSSFIITAFLAWFVIFRKTTV